MKPLPKVHRVQCAAITKGCLSALVWEGAGDGINRHTLELNGWRLDHGKWVCGHHDKPNEVDVSWVEFEQ